MFTVIALDTKQPVSGPEGILCFDNGSEAAAVAQTYTVNTGRKYQPRPIIESNGWQEREKERFANGIYQHLPWVHESWFQGSIAETEHFAHISTDKPGMIAFTENAAKGTVDRQTRVGPGVYLTRYFSDILSSVQIRDLATDYAKRFESHELQFATTADEIEQVYLHGPDSCMSNNQYRKQQDWGCFRTPFHPCRVYAAGDLAIAYLSKDGRITARSLVWPEKKTFGRIYGDLTRLRDLLYAADYKCADPIGARLTAHAVDSGYVCPYLDKGCSRGQGTLFVRLDETKKFLIIDYHGDYDCASLTGLTEHARYNGSLYDDGTVDANDDCDDENGEYCASCEESGFDSDDMYYIEDRGESWCESCADNAYICEETGERYARDRDIVRMANGPRGQCGAIWSRRYFENNGFTCEATGDNYPDSDSVRLHDGTVWCESHFSDNGFTCSHCDENFSNDDESEHESGSCEACAEYDSNGHVVMQGRDESSTQIEMPLSEIVGPCLPWPRKWRIGDMVQMKPDAIYHAGAYSPIREIGSPLFSAMPIILRYQGCDFWVYARDIDYINPANMNAEGI